MKISIDCEASGPCPGYGDVISFGAVVIEPGLTQTFRSPDMKPTCDLFNEGAYKSIGLTRQQHLLYAHTVVFGFQMFHQWLTMLVRDGNQLTMVSDNPAFDWQWINWGFYHAGFDRNPLGHSARRIGDMYAGLTGKENNTSRWKKLRETKHTHDPLDDAIGNAEAYLKIWAGGR
jgi:hypothetical protein